MTDQVCHTVLPVLRGRRLVCSGSIVRYKRSITTWQFRDYSWQCSVCDKRHCSQCFYESDGETITVIDCGRMDA